MRYRVQHRIATLSSMAVIRSERIEDFFEAERIRFSPWDLSVGGRYRADFWLAESEVEANSLIGAVGQYWQSLVRVVPRLALVTQAYIGGASQPLLIVKDGADVAFLRYMKQKRGVGLHFTVDQLDALNALLSNTSIPEEFFYYWNEAIDTASYTAKILLMLSAVEAWAKRVKREQW